MMKLLTLILLFSFSLSLCVGAEPMRGFAKPIQKGVVASEDVQKNILLEVVLDKMEASVGESIILTYYLYTRYDTRYEGFIHEPHFQRFWIEWESAEKMGQNETVEHFGKKYIRAIVARIKLTPIFPGVHSIYPGSLKVSYKEIKGLFSLGSGNSKELVFEIAPITISVQDVPASQIPSHIQKVRDLAASQAPSSLANREKRITFLLDVSGSMLAEDWKSKNRLSVAKLSIEAFVAKHPELPIAVVPFAAEVGADVVLKDVDSAKTSLKAMQARADKETALGDALFQVVQEKAGSGKNETLILISDGVNTGGHLDPLTGLAIAKAKGFVIFTIIIGAPGKAPYPVDDLALGKHYVDADISEDEELMKQLAQETGGKYFRCEKEGQIQEIISAISQIISA